MNMHEYQQQAKQTAFYPNRGDNFVYPSLGLVNEAGEVAGKIKKLMRDQNKFSPTDLSAEDRAALEKEIGDVLWYITILADEVGCSLEDVAATNVEKLQGRKTRETLKGDGDDR